MAIKHFLQVSDFTLDEYDYVMERARVIKRKFKNYEPYHPLVDRTLVMILKSIRPAPACRSKAACNSWAALRST